MCILSIPTTLPFSAAIFYTLKTGNRDWSFCHFCLIPSPSSFLPLIHFLSLFSFNIPPLILQRAFSIPVPYSYPLFQHTSSPTNSLVYFFIQKNSSYPFLPKPIFPPYPHFPNFISHPFHRLIHSLSLQKKFLIALYTCILYYMIYFLYFSVSLTFSLSKNASGWGQFLFITAKKTFCFSFPIFQRLWTNLTYYQKFAKCFILYLSKYHSKP